MKKCKMLISLLLISMLLFGCTMMPQKLQELDYSSQEITIYTSEYQEQHFYRSYGNLILDHFPGLELRVITVPADQYGQSTDVEEIKQHMPDLIVSDPTTYKKLIADNFLMSIDSLIKKDSFPIDNYARSMISQLEDESGILYGLAPDAYMEGIFFNKDLFNDHAIDYPTNGMDWLELFQVAARFTDGVAGFERPSVQPSNLLMEIIYTNKWYFIDTDNDKIMFHRPDWEQGIQTIVQLYQGEAVMKGNGDAFLKGEAALYDGYLSYASKLLDTNTFTWGFVTNPVNTNDRNVGNSIGVNRVLSIPHTSANRELAWEIIQVLMSEQVADYYENYLLFPTHSTLKSQMQQYKGVELEAFWEQEFDRSPSLLSNEISGEFVSEFYQLLDDALEQAIQAAISVEECFDMIEQGTREAYEKEKLR